MNRPGATPAGPAARLRTPYVYMYVYLQRHVCARWSVRFEHAREWGSPASAVTSAIQRAGAQDTTVRRTMTRRGDERDGMCVMMKHALLERQILLNNMNMSAHTVLVARGEDKQSCRLSSRDSTPN